MAHRMTFNQTGYFDLVALANLVPELRRRGLTKVMIVTDSVKQRKFVCGDQRDIPVLAIVEPDLMEAIQMIAPVMACNADYTGAECRDIATP